MTLRARDLGIPFDGTPGPLNALTDVPGVEVGFATLVEGEAIRTGVTAILPRGRSGVGVACAAATSSLNGNGELTGRTWIDESGSLALPVLLTNSHSVGAVHRGADLWVHENHPAVAAQWMLPVVGETWDGYLNDINADAIGSAEVAHALDTAEGGPVAEGSVGGGTGMNCYGFKGGTGTASRIIERGDDGHTVAALVQANFGSRRELMLAGRHLGRDTSVPNPFEDDEWFEDDMRVAGGAGSVIVVIATDAPLLPGHLAAVSRRVPLGLARTGTTGSHFSGDIFLAFSTANAGAFGSRLGDASRPAEQISALPWGALDPYFAATVECVEEAVANALIAARDMTGRSGHVSYALPHDEVRAAFAPPRGVSS
jgi:L-aminopeptidase/D-esterase-like protein